MAAGAVSFIGGILALANPASASVTAITLAGWAFVIVAGLQGWAAWKSKGFKGTAIAGVLAALAGFMGLSLLLGPFGDGSLLRVLLGLLLLASGAAKLWAARGLKGDELMPILLGAGAVSVVLGLLVLFNLSIGLGVLLGLELLANGVALVLLGLRQKNNAPAG